MLDDDATDILLRDVHRFIGRAASEAIEAIRTSAAQLSYPPDVNLTAGECSALASLCLSPAAASALRKIVADACSRPFFHFFCLLDGVGDPEDWTRGVWLGVDLNLPSDDEDGEDREMLHDRFFDTAPNPEAS